MDAGVEIMLSFTQFYSVLVRCELPNGSNGVLNRRPLSKKSWFGWVRLSPFGSRWVRNGSEAVYELVNY